MKSYFNSKINLLAISRGKPEVVSPLLPDKGQVFIYADLVAAEPTTTLNYCYCKALEYFTLTGKGKKPFYDGKLFMIDDVYLALAGSTNLFRPKFQRLLDEGLFDNWVTDPNSIKEHKSIKPIRKLAKPASLGLAYGLGAVASKHNPKGGLQNTLIDQGFDISAEECKQIYNTYWDILYPELKSYKQMLATQIRQKQLVLNALGFKINPKKPTDAFNALIQSSVASILDLCELHFDDWLESVAGTFIMRIHDEIVCQVPEEHATATCNRLVEIGAEVSEMLGFKYPIKFDPKVARNFFEGK